MTIKADNIDMRVRFIGYSLIRIRIRKKTNSTVNSSSKGLMGGDRIQATLVFEKLI